MTGKFFYSSIPHRFVRSLRERKVFLTLQAILSYCVDLFFDVRYRTDTVAQVELSAMAVENSQKEHAQRYNASHVIPLRKLFKILKIKPSNVFVDLGCGKGRVLLIASEFGLREVRGVEFSPLLCAVANNNCRTFKAIKKTNTNFAVFESDVLDYRIKDDEDIFYLFNPFDAYILKQVLQDISASLHRKKRKILIIYCHAVGRDMVEETMNPVKFFDFSFWGSNFTVFEVE